MTVDRINNIKNNLLDAIKDIEKQIQFLSQKEPLFGFITPKYIKCGKETCRCQQDARFRHGPYFYLRLEPEYRYKKYLGKKIPEEVEERINIGSTIKELERKRKKLTITLGDIE